MTIIICYDHLLRAIFIHVHSANYRTGTVSVIHLINIIRIYDGTNRPGRTNKLMIVKHTVYKIFNREIAYHRTSRPDK